MFENNSGDVNRHGNKKILIREPHQVQGFGNPSSLDQGEMSQGYAVAQTDLGPSGPAVGR